MASGLPLKTIKSARLMSKRASKPVVNVAATIYNILAIIVVFLVTLASMLTWKNLKGHTVKNGAKRKNNMNWFYHQFMKRIILTFNPFWERKLSFEVDPEELKKNTYLYACNHTSYSDFIMLSGVADLNYVGVGKSDLLHMPIVGPVFQNNGFLPVEFEQKPNGKWGTKPGSTERLMRWAKKDLENDVSIILFPEGTIVLDYELGKFKPGFFKLAIETDTPVVPIGTWGNQFIWPMLSKSVPSKNMSSGTSYVKVGTPMEPLNPSELEGMSDALAITDYVVDKYNLSQEEAEFKDLEIAIAAVADAGKDSEETDEESELLKKSVVSLFTELVRTKVLTLRLDCEEMLAKDEEKRVKDDEKSNEYYADLIQKAVDQGKEVLSM
uniref:Phospholipid/glycerol acyltransferase domain-containing protein n=1 Tax=Aplanochytrium stocchinoi TaxID=215587 RepID=A0A7S3V2U1_9STRA|mmetsp:Transcript_22387/g.28633  ORF Transcript_22387/g.28633 Transcript_22387/m.28633 type:complete len:382 (+) Transcript_22387:93-1238(+)|eukprot:CAMPEP_0204861110 /NCGR_PEP_ID=MMETSP1348-20121228/1222_1 /ASSEMBLY_ACC=CAM_ASM_000700 /TAXON_ID=215587 /ORGANISM="Aplanochytrium stocchinoi, Strain GSBS06" /LENGTH=381 /DNA_ID=CAMNT_0052010289 /DNA_START=13 /DNA_END=1158 /DNA_ORIENTATION=+